MANGQQSGANGQARRNKLPRVHSEEGVIARYNQRAATMPSGRGTKWVDGYTKPGSRNPRKVGRG